MIDDGPMKCSCGHMDWFGCYDKETGYYICHRICIKKIGHEPPYSNEEYSKIGMVKKIKTEEKPPTDKTKLEIVKERNGWVVRYKGWLFYWYAGYDFGGMYGWWPGILGGKEYFSTEEEALRVSQNFGLY
jgi:hypothetical protein